MSSAPSAWCSRSTPSPAERLAGRSTSTGGRIATGKDAVEWAREGVERGAGEILLTSMDRDGTTDGYDLELTRGGRRRGRRAGDRLGGAGELDHLVSAISEGGADAVLAASIFHYGTYSIAEAKASLEEAGIPVRLA